MPPFTFIEHLHHSKIKAKLEEVSVFDLLREGVEDSKLKESVIRILAMKEAVGKADRPLIEEYALKDVLAFIRDKKNSISCQIGKTKSQKAISVPHAQPPFSYASILLLHL